MVWLVIIEWVSRLVLLLLVGLSVWSISIMIDRYNFFKKLNLPITSFKKLMREKNYVLLLSESKTNQTIAATLIQALTGTKNSDKQEKIFEVFVEENRSHLEKGLSVLGTLGAVTPFIGLLGTILGIIVSFGALSKGDGNTNSVMFSLAEALTLTAVGLLVAIPAVIAFNYFSRKVRTTLSELASLKDLFIAFQD